jgi:hypothetical protein
VGDLVWGLGDVAFHVHGYETTGNLENMCFWYKISCSGS